LISFVDVARAGLRRVSSAGSPGRAFESRLFAQFFRPAATPKPNSFLPQIRVDRG
jgi:hypothetical protein